MGKTALSLLMQIESRREASLTQAERDAIKSLSAGGVGIIARHLLSMDWRVKVGLGSWGSV